MPVATVSAPPSAKLTVIIDNYGSTAAVSDVNAVTFDLSQSTGDGLTYSIDFGDGMSSQRSVAQHVFSTPHYGVFQVRATVTDRLGRTDVVAKRVQASRLDGSGFCPAMWDHINYASDPSVTHFRFTGQSGGNVTGKLEWYMPGVIGTPPLHQFEGVLFSDGRLEITVDDSARLTGFVGLLEPAGITGLYNAGHMRLTASGAPRSGVPMEFRCHDPY